MNTTTYSLSIGFVLAGLGLGLTLPTGVAAQQQPLTSRMMGEPHGQATPAADQRAAELATPAEVVGGRSGATVLPPPMAADAPGSHYYGRAVGSATRHLLQMQRDGQHAGQRLPTLGVEASASYRRYLDSFNHPIPEFYEATVGKNGDSGR